jgi:signal transduction histidine kinase
MIRNAKKVEWSRRFQESLRKHIAQGPKASLLPALGLGRQAVALGLETLDVARIHKQALMTLAAPGVSSRSRPKTIEQATSFFAEAIVPIEKTHRAALKDDVHVKQLKQTLQKRMAESSASRRHLVRSIAQRRSVETALVKSGKHHLSLLRESRRLQKRLRLQARKILSVQENERQEMSRQLHDEVAQTLLGINVWLVMLKTMDKANRVTLKKEIVNTQRLVKQFTKRVNQFAHAFIIQL